MDAFDLSTAWSDLGQRETVCDKHGTYAASGRAMQLSKIRREIWSPCPACASEKAGADAAAEVLRQARAKQAAIEAMVGQSALPTRFIGRSFDNFVVNSPGHQHALQTCVQYVRNFEVHLKQGTVLVLSGPPGTGKSHLAAAILQALMPRHVGAYFTFMDMLRMLRDTWRNGSESSEAEMLARLARLPLLVLDEIGVQYGTDSERTSLFDVMDRRYRDQRPVVLLTNLDTTHFREVVGDRIYDRLTETCVWVPFDGESYRSSMPLILDGSF